MVSKIINCTAALMLICACGQAIENEIDIRVSLDASTHEIMTEIPVSAGRFGESFVERNFYYPRIKRLSDGALLMSFMNDHYGWDLYTARSEDNGKTWSEATLVCRQYPAESTVGDDMMVFVNPDFIELQDGRLMLAYQWRYKEGYGDIPNTNLNCGIGICYSYDKGRSWSEGRSVYRGRCWEPGLLQLPSGEIQMYITSSQNVVNGLSCPRTVIIRSFDGGKTWQGKELCNIYDNEVISYTIDDRFGYDGMATAVVLDDGSIAMTLEVWSGKYVVDQTPVVVKTSAEENWYLDKEKILNEGGPDYPQKKQLNKDFIAYGPYLAKVSTGETLCFAAGLYKGVQSQWLLVGDRKADNFGYGTTAFNGYWGCVDYIGADRVMLSGAEKYRDSGNKVRGRLHYIQGRINRSKEIMYGDSEFSGIKEFDRENNKAWFLGKKFDSSVFYDFGATKKDFIFNSWYYTDSITSFTLENSDAPVIFVSRGNDIFKIVTNASGKYEVSRQEHNSFRIIHKGNSKVDVEGSVNDDTDTDLGFASQVAVPWEFLGGRPDCGEEFRVHVARWYKGKSKEKFARAWEELEGENPEVPSQWLKIIFK